jgi:hypothetical protein
VGSTALFAAGHDGGVEAVAEAGRELVDLVRAIDFDGLAGGVEGDFAVLAALKMLLELGARVGSYLVVNEVIEEGEKFRAGHFALPFFLRK